jgi:hypothetical protein
MRCGRMGRLLFCVMLELAALGGAPLRPEQIVELMQTLHKPKVAHVLPLEDESGGPAPR